ncbi:MAG: redoxin domain-containing protein, partial [Gammaproteobacteria bacterium]|nr:redoxin domain-containing protein [Gammaproteobacteria bacterium]
MQLGELQHQIARFERRGVTVVALSVDEPTASLAMIERLGLSFDLGSDPQQNVVKAFGVQNPNTRELAIHAVYIVDTHGTVFYRKVGRRRPVSQELIDAIDAFRGVYPRTDEVIEPKKFANVAFPRNNFQALITVAGVAALPQNIDKVQFNRVRSLVNQGRSDDALVAFKALTLDSAEAGEQDLFDTAAWLTRRLFFADKPEAVDAGQLLSQRLARISQLEAQLAASDDPDQHDEQLHSLARARAGLSLTRAEISNNAG